MKYLKIFIVFPIIIGLVLMCNFLTGFDINLTNTAKADDSVAISASVTGTVSCTSEPVTVNFPTLTTSQVYTATADATTTSSCSYAGGCKITIDNTGGGGNPGLYNSSGPTDLIPSPNAAYDPTATLAAGTEGYGIKVSTTTTGSNGTLVVLPRYNTYTQGGTNVVGGLLLAATESASSTGAFTGRELVVAHKAAIHTDTLSGSYSDTVNYTCASN